MTERLHFHFSLLCIGEGNGNPLQCSCLENPRDRGAWWAAVYGVAQSRTQLKWLSSSRLIITLLPGSKHLLLSWLQSPSAVILELPKIKSATISTISPSICHEVIRPDAMILVLWMLSFKPTFSLSSFTFIRRLFSSSSLSAIRVVLKKKSTQLIIMVWREIKWKIKAHREYSGGWTSVDVALLMNSPGKSLWTDFWAETWSKERDEPRGCLGGDLSRQENQQVQWFWEKTMLWIILGRTV